VFFSDTEQVWLGISDLGKKEEWRYVSSPYAIYKDNPLVGYFDWHKGEPNDVAGHEKCVQYLKCVKCYQTEEYHWNDETCDETDPFFCQKPAVRQ
jgi:hypothetical protein